MQELKSLKVHLLELLYSSILNKTFDNGLEYVTKIILQSDSVFNPIKSEFTIIAKILSTLFNSILLFKANSNFGEYVLNYVRVDSSTANLLIKSGSKKKIILLIILNYIVPLLIDLSANLLKNKFKDFSNRLMKNFKTLKTIKIILDLFYKFRYVFKKKFMFYDIVDHLVGNTIVNQGSKEANSDNFVYLGRQINLFFLYMMMRVGEWYYQKEQTTEALYDILPHPQKNSRSNQTCPVCDQQLNLNRSPVTVKCCGFVFCENCVISHVNINGKCPSCFSSINDLFLVKIYQ